MKINCLAKHQQTNGLLSESDNIVVPVPPNDLALLYGSYEPYPN